LPFLLSEQAALPADEYALNAFQALRAEFARTLQKTLWSRRLSDTAALHVSLADLIDEVITTV
jgi:hypothetical protein